MRTFLSTEINEVMQATHYRPALSVILPLEPQMRFLKELKHVLKITADKVETELKKDYPQKICELMMEKMARVTAEIKVHPGKKSLALYLSPIFEKVLFMDITAQERIVIDESFEIRDLVYDKKHDNQCLLLLLSGKQVRMYLMNAAGFIRISSSVPESITAYVNQWPQRVSNFTDPSERKQIVILKFLQHVDKALGQVINEYHLPIFVLGTEKILGHFKKLTKHKGAIAEYIAGDISRTNFSRLKEILEPHLNCWQDRKQTNILKQLELAASKKKLTTGIKSVWKAAMNNTGHNLFVENNFVCAAHRGAQLDIIDNMEDSFNEFSYYKDAVDDVIEKIVANGGDVDFVAPDVLKLYNRIALVDY